MFNTSGGTTLHLNFCLPPPLKLACPPYSSSLATFLFIAALKINTIKVKFSQYSTQHLQNY